MTGTTQADLLVVAAGLAARARRALDSNPTDLRPGEPHQVGGDPDKATTLTAAAKVTLEAAALAQNVGPGEIDQALAALQSELAAADLGLVAETMAPTEFLGHVLRTVVAWRREVLAAAGFESAYGRLRELAETLERDFVAGGTDTSRRIAARIRVALDDVDGVLRGATGGERHPDQEPSP